MTGLAEVWLGTSGYVYRHWRKGVFYPVGLPAREELGYYAGRFRTVELNNPFYGLPTAEMFQRPPSAELGPILFQLPPTQQLELTRLDDFLALLSKARRWVLEFRHPSWHTSEVYQLLTDHGVALCIPVGGGLHPDRVTTAPFTYIRMHRGQEPGGGFADAELVAWAAQIRALRGAGKEVYVYFNNDWGGYAIRDAHKLKGLLGIER